MHPVAERHQRIQALLKFSRNAMKRTGINLIEREELIDNYCMRTWALGATARRDYVKTILAALRDEDYQLQLEKKTLEQKHLPHVPKAIMLKTD